MLVVDGTVRIRRFDMVEQRRGSVLGEGIVTGVIGATAVAVWFLIVDSVAGRPFYTPSLLGEALFSIFGPPAGESPTLHIVGYTLWHYAAYIVIGTILAFIVRRADDDPNVLAGLAIFFFVYQVGFYGVVALMSQWELLGNLAWYQIGIANIVSSVLMGWYLYRGHPRVAEEMRFALDGRES